MRSHDAPFPLQQQLSSKYLVFHPQQMSTLAVGSHISLQSLSQHTEVSISMCTTQAESYIIVFMTSALSQKLSPMAKDASHHRRDESTTCS